MTSGLCCEEAAEQAQLELKDQPLGFGTRSRELDDVKMGTSVYP